MVKASSPSFALGCAGACSFTLVSAVGSFVTSTGSSRASAALSAALLSVPPAVLYGLLTYALVRFAWPPVARVIGGLQLGRFVDRDPAAPREPVILLHAFLIALPLGLAPMLLASKLLLVRLRAIESDDLRELLSLIGLTGLIGGAVLLAIVAMWPLRLALARLDRRMPLPLPASAPLRSIVWLGLPVCAIAVVALRFLEPVMGPLASPLWLVLVVGVQVIVYGLLGGRLSGGASRRTAVIVSVALALSLPLAVVGVDRVLGRSADSVLALEQARPGGLLLTSARAMSDVDRDGASAMFGEQDCAAFSSRRSPLARDVPGNGVDEDCDGADLKANSIPVSPTFYGALPPEAVQGYDIVWFVVDAVRADHTSMLGYKRRTTPNLDELAKESLVFENAFSQSSATMLSFPSMLTGVDPARVVWAKEGKRLQISKDQRRYVSTMLARKKYRTGFIVSPYIKRRLSGMMTDWAWTASSVDDQELSSSSAAAQAARFIGDSRKSASPFLLVAYLPAPHAPYVSHGPSYPKVGKEKTDRYDAEIMNADRNIGFVLDVLRENSERWDKTIVIFTSDHGEEFLEHGATVHAQTCYAESIHVPLLVRIPGQEPMRVKRPVQLLDIVPTLLELTGTTEEGKKLEGSSLLLSAKAPERISADRPLFCTIISQKPSQGDFVRRSVLSGRWKLISELRGAKKQKLYDVVADPREQQPISVKGDRAAIADRLGGWLRAQLTGNVHLIKMDDE